MTENVGLVQAPVPNERQTTIEKCLKRIDYLINWLFQPVCSKSLGVARALFGLMMVIDVPDERGLAHLYRKFEDPLKCHFPLFDWIAPLNVEYMGLVYLAMWIGAAGICLGHKFKFSCILFVVPYWYLFLLNKTTWNNHSYLYGLLGIIFLFTSAENAYSMDGLVNPNLKDAPVPRWNYVILRFQFVLLYFYAGLKKLDQDWIKGYSMMDLSTHWVFQPFRYLLSDAQIDLWLVHTCGLLLDLTAGFLLLVPRTRVVAMLATTSFHLLNSRMFHIGQFPYVCIALTPIFCSYDWPCTVLSWWNKRPITTSKKPKAPNESVTWKERCGSGVLALYVTLQLFLPYSHFITKGYNNWTNGLYGYSWDMMVHSWETSLLIVKINDTETGEEMYLDPEAWVDNTRYSKHGDMLVQYARCLERNLKDPAAHGKHMMQGFTNPAIYIDVWVSLNARFQQRMFDPRQNLLNLTWSPFEPVSWLMPLLTDLTPWRSQITELQNSVRSWSNFSDTLFIADFPDLYLENFVSPDLRNVSLTVLRGSVVLEDTVDGSKRNTTLLKGESIKIETEKFHKIYTLPPEPSCYVYIFVNKTLETLEGSESHHHDTLKLKEEFLENVFLRVENSWKIILGVTGSESHLQGTLKEEVLENFLLRVENVLESLQVIRACLFKVIFNIIKF